MLRVEPLRARAALLHPLLSPADAAAALGLHVVPLVVLSSAPRAQAQGPPVAHDRLRHADAHARERRDRLTRAPPTREGAGAGLVWCWVRLVRRGGSAHPGWRRARTSGAGWCGARPRILRCPLRAAPAVPRGGVASRLPVAACCADWLRRVWHWQGASLLRGGKHAQGVQRGGRDASRLGQGAARDPVSDQGRPRSAALSRQCH